MTDLKLVPLAEQLEPGVGVLAVRLKAADNVALTVLRTLYRRHYQIVRVDIAARPDLAKLAVVEAAHQNPRS